METPEMPRLDIAQIPADVRDQFAGAVCDLILCMLADPDTQQEIWPDMPRKSKRVWSRMETG